jgi:hypothetical protein
VTLLFYMALTGSLYFLPFLMMQVHGYSAIVAGSVFLPFVAMSFAPLGAHLGGGPGAGRFRHGGVGAFAAGPFVSAEPVLTSLV